MKLAQGGIETGTILVNKYRVDGVLGQGGMGMVYRAHHLTLDEPVAIKVLRRDVSVDPETVTRFVREAQAAVRLKSEHVARIHDVGTFEDGLPYMVMELLDGADLGQLVDANGAMVPHAAIDLVLQACDAIAEAHSLGIVHRDIKPTNLYVSFRPDQSAIVKVLDFGISKSGNGADLSLTQTSSILGTPAYMSPEQMRSARSVDARTDIWSLGTVLYELLEGRQPFNAESFSEMCVMVAMDPPAPMTLAPELEPLIQRCLAKNPDQRYANVAELTIDLARFAGNTDAARRYVTRAHRTLGLPVPATIDTNPALLPLGSYEYTPASIPITALRAPGSGPVGAATTSTTPTLVRPATLPRGLMIGAVLATLLGVGGSLAYLEMTGEDKPAKVERAPAAQDLGPGIERTVDVARERAGSASLTAGSATGAGSGASAGAGSGSNAGSGVGSGSGDAAGSVAPIVELDTTPPTVRRPAKRPPKRPPARPPHEAETVKKPPTPTQKPKCDPFASRRDCK